MTEGLTIDRTDSYAAIDAILDRKSVRAFRGDSIDPVVIEKLLKLASCAPSWGDTQPWNVDVVTGSRLEALSSALVHEFDAGVRPNPDVPWPRFPDYIHERSRENGMQLFQRIGLAREDQQGRHEYYLRMQRFNGAPAVLFFSLDRGSHLPWSMLDLGSFIQTLMIAATAHGLGSCAMAVANRFPDVVRQHLSIREDRQIICGVALGYAADEPINEFRSARLPLSEFVVWHRD